MPPADDPLARLKGRAVLVDFLRYHWKAQGRRPLSLTPKIAGEQVDLYILFESVRALGGIDFVAQHKLFPTLRQLLLLPESATNYANHLRHNYDRYFTSLVSNLSTSLDAAYQLARLYAKDHKWLHARVDVPPVARQQPHPHSQPPPTLHPVSSLRKRPADSDHHSSSTPATAAAATVVADIDDAADDRDFNKHPEATRAAIRARINANAPEPNELSHHLFAQLPNPAARSPLPFLDLRNHIIRLWYRDPTRRLDVFSAMEDVPAPYHPLGCRVFTMLEAAGLINFGAIPMVTSIAIRTSIGADRHLRKHVAIIGAGISGLIAARQLRAFGVSVTIFEAQPRAGGRIRRASANFSAAIDMGAMIVTGAIQNPLSVLATQTGAEMHHIASATCPLFDIDGHWVPTHADNWAEREYNAVLAATDRFRNRPKYQKKANFMSLGLAFQKALERRVARRNARVQSQEARLAVGGEDVTGGQKELTSEEAKPRGLMSPNTVFDDDDDVNMLSDTEAPLKRPRVAAQQAPTEVELPIDELSDGSSPTSTVRGVQKSSHMRRSPNGGNGSADSGVESSALLSHPRDDKLISRLLRWHIANLEYACAAELDKVSLKHWDQDDPYGFDGDHVLLKGGFEQLVRSLSDGLEKSIRYDSPVVAVNRTEKEGPVELEISNPRDTDTQKLKFDAVLVTVPLGVLKTETILFDPPLPDSKKKAIKRLGTGGLMKVAMEFSHQFWADTDMFGALRESVEKRGAFYCFWSFVRCTGRPVLTGMVAEPAVQAMEKLPDDEIVAEGMMVLRRKYPDAPDPILFEVSRWSRDEYARGAYTNIPVGSSGADYDHLAKPVGHNLFFAGEHTCRKYPTTCASGIISGIREACRIAEKFGRVELMAQTYTENVGVAFKPVVQTESHKVSLERHRPTGGISYGSPPAPLAKT